MSVLHISILTLLPDLDNIRLYIYTYIHILILYYSNIILLFHGQFILRIFQNCY